jgi:hypothetical protein
MTHDRSLDDLPLAAYGGSGMELTAADEAVLDVAPEAVVDPLEADPSMPPGPFAHASAGDAPLEGEPATPRGLPVVLAALATRGVGLLRTSRLAAGAAFGGLIAVGLLLVVATAGQKPNAAGADASASAAPIVAATREPGNATLVLTGELEQEVTFTESKGEGAPGAPIAVTWTDPTANTFGLSGAVDRGTRSTDEALVLQWTIVVEEKPISFTSASGECTLGMAVNPTNVFGTFTCKQLQSDDGKYVVEATGTYRT